MIGKRELCYYRVGKRRPIDRRKRYRERAHTQQHKGCHPDLNALDMVGNSVGPSERGRLRRRSLLKGGAAGIAGLAGCIRPNSVTADGPAES